MPLTGNRPEVSVDTVLFATDFSKSAENAAIYAQLVAGALDASLLVAHAFLLTQAAEEVELREKGHSKQRNDLEALLSAEVLKLNTPALRVSSALVEGVPHDAIPLLAEQHAPALLVLGTHGAGTVMHKLIGSVAEKILRSTRWPCLTVGPLTPHPSAATDPFRRVLYATDFTPAATRAAAFAIALSESSGGSLDVLNVLPESARKDSSTWTEIESRYAHALAQIVPEHAREFMSPRTYVETGDAHERILDHIREHNIDLLVLGVRKSSHLGLEMRVSNAFHLIANATCPVLTITS